MRLKSILLALASVAHVNAQIAPVVTGNPDGVTYQAILPNSATTNIRGYIAGTTPHNGTGTTFNINFYGFGLDGPFSEPFLAPSGVVIGLPESATRVLELGS